MEELKTNRIALEKANEYLEVNHRLGYNKAIDDFANLIKQRKFDYILEFDDFVDRLTEQLKDGVLNE